ncbi:hypothetical protein MNBD_GAMMA26-1222 [hydrothermal vent metagenome]|uniref:Uncharacterized protein n=1 Tax=hydrothermal vent metagenome TaxID=652676 RepID=A0A3B1BH46_9ZZZZ
MQEQRDSKPPSTSLELLEQQASALRAAAMAYAENIPRLKRARRGRRSMIILCTLLVIGVIASGYSAWGPGADDPSDGFIWGPFCGLMALMLIIAVGGFFIMVNRIQGLSEIPVSLARRLREIHRQHEVELGQSTEDDKPDNEELTGIYAAIAEYVAEPAEVADIVEQELDQIQQAAALSQTGTAT